MLVRLPTVRSPDEITDMLFRAASKVQAGGKDRLGKAKAKSIRKLHVISNRADREFSSYVVGFPSFQKNRFEWEMADLLVGADKLKISIARVHGCKNSIVTITNRIAREIAKAQSVERIHALRDSAYGRVSSLIAKSSADIDFLRNAASKLVEIPDLQEKNSVVIAGFPNVGKSMLVSKLSNARTRVEAYPFTTTKIIVGHRLIGRRKFQFVDCPGLTERAFETRNVSERKSLAAIRHLAGVLVYLVDPSGSCGYSVDHQLALKQEIEKEFGTTRTLLVFSKADLHREATGLAVSALTGKGIEEMLSAVEKMLPELPASPNA